MSAYSNKKILFTTVAGGMPDYFEISVSRFFRTVLPTPSFGLRFIKQNIECIDVLEYPSFEQYLKAVAHYDIVGISFYMKDIPLVTKMVEAARKSGVKEIWGGNYGVLCDQAQDLFDKTFVGYAEDDLYRLIYGTEPPELAHPLLDTYIGVRFTPVRIKYGFLFTSRGCTHKCTFCQTTAFTKQRSLISLKAIEDALLRYKKIGVKLLFIMDENFNAASVHGQAVIELLARNDFAWGVCTRAETLHGRVDDYRKMGMLDCIIGLESLRQENLDILKRGSQLNRLLGTIEELKENNIYIHATYMIGYEQDTVESIRNDIIKLKGLGIDSCQLCVLTPFPKTDLWTHITANYQLCDDLTLFDAYHLTYNHAHIDFQQMNETLNWSRKEIYNIKNIFNAGCKIYKNNILKRL